MRAIHPKIVTDEAGHPVAVLIDYADWLKIKSKLQKIKNGKNFLRSITVYYVHQG